MEDAQHPQPGGATGDQPDAVHDACGRREVVGGYAVRGTGEVSRNDTVPGAGGVWLACDQDAVIPPSVSRVSGGCCDLLRQRVNSNVHDLGSPTAGPNTAFDLPAGDADLDEIRGGKG